MKSTLIVVSLFISQAFAQVFTPVGNIATSTEYTLLNPVQIDIVKYIPEAQLAILKVNGVQKEYALKLLSADIVNEKYVYAIELLTDTLIADTGCDEVEYVKYSAKITKANGVVLATEVTASHVYSYDLCHGPANVVTVDYEEN